MTDAAQTQLIAERKKGVGGTDISAILGLNPWRSAVDVWADKTGRALPYTDSPLMKAGRMLEPAILNWYEEETGERVTRNLPQLVKDDVLIGHADGLVERIGKVIDAKNSGSFKGYGRGDNSVPIHYFAQLQWYMGLADLPTADLAVLFNGNDLRIFPVQFDADLFESMRAAALMFWDRHVVPDVPPKPETGDDGLRIWPKSVKRGIEASADITAAIARLRELRAAARAISEEIEPIEDAIRLAFKDADTLLAGDVQLATYRNENRTKFDAAKFAADYPDLYVQYARTETTRTFRLSKEKKQ